MTGVSFKVKKKNIGKISHIRKLEDLRKAGAKDSVKHTFNQKQSNFLQRETSRVYETQLCYVPSILRNVDLFTSSSGGNLHQFHLNFDLRANPTRNSSNKKSGLSIGALFVFLETKVAITTKGSNQEILSKRNITRQDSKPDL